jgi:hypothetical protein
MVIAINEKPFELLAFNLNGNRIGSSAGLLLANTLRCFAAAAVKPVIRHRMAMPLSTRWGDGGFLHRAESTRRVHGEGRPLLPTVRLQ